MFVSTVNLVKKNLVKAVDKSVAVEYYYAIVERVFNCCEKKKRRTVNMVTSIKTVKPVKCDCDVIHAEVVNQVSNMMPQSKAFLELADLYKAFSDPTRVKVLWALHYHELCVCDLAALLDMTKSAISHQLKTLRMSNLVKFQKQGKVVYYSLADDHVKDIFEKGFEHIHHS